MLSQTMDMFVMLLDFIFLMNTSGNDAAAFFW